MRAVETRYNGYRFRSRTEARWAVFLDYAGLRYEYEREAFDLFGIYYLPDFYVYEHEGRGVHSCWIEVKGIEPTPDEQEKLRLLCDTFRCEGFLLIGQPEPDGACYHYHPTGQGGGFFERKSQRSLMASLDASEECFDAGRGKRFDRQDFAEDGSPRKRSDPLIIRLDTVAKLKADASLYEETLENYQQIEAENVRLRAELKKAVGGNNLLQVTVAALVGALLLLFCALVWQ